MTLTTSKPSLIKFICEGTKVLGGIPEMQQHLESFLIQKTKEDWLNLGDTNDKYFFDKLKQHHHRNGISSIKLDDGSCT